MFVVFAEDGPFLLFGIWILMRRWDAELLRSVADLQRRHGCRCPIGRSRATLCEAPQVHTGWAAIFLNVPLRVNLNRRSPNENLHPSFLGAVAIIAVTSPTSADANAPAGRYVVTAGGTGHGTVQDTKTGLIWQQTVTSTSAAYNWAGAKTYCASTAVSTSLGGTGWRLPTLKELQTIVDYTQATAPIIDSTAFPSTPASGFWSSSPLAGSSSNAWFVHFSNGNTYTSTSLTVPQCSLRALRTGILTFGLLTLSLAESPGVAPAVVREPSPTTHGVLQSCQERRVVDVVLARVLGGKHRLIRSDEIKAVWLDLNRECAGTEEKGVSAAIMPIDD